MLPGLKRSAWRRFFHFITVSEYLNENDYGSALQKMV